MYLAALGPEVYMIPKGHDVCALLGCRMSQHRLQRGEIAVNVGQNQRGQGLRPPFRILSIIA